MRSVNQSMMFFFDLGYVMFSVVAFRFDKFLASRSANEKGQALKLSLANGKSETSTVKIESNAKCEAIPKVDTGISVREGL